MEEPSSNYQTGYTKFYNIYKTMQEKTRKGKAEKVATPDHKETTSTLII